MVFHAGTHKTGTTAIQSAFRRWSDAGRLDGLVYPDPRIAFGLDRSPIDHLCVLRAAARHSWRDRLRLSLFAAGTRQRTGRTKTAFLSTERAWITATPDCSHRDTTRWWDGHRTVLERLPLIFGAFSFEFLLVVRRPETFAEALYSEAIVSSGSTTDFTAFIGRHAYRYQYAKQIELFRAIAPTRVVCYEIAKAEGLIGTVAAFLGHDAPPPMPSGAVVRPTLAPRAIEWLRREKASGDLTRRDRQRRWRFGIEMAGGPPFDGPVETFWPDEAARDAFMAAALRGFDAVRFPPPRTMAAPLRWSDADQRRATLAFVEWERANSDGLMQRERSDMRPFDPG